MQYLSKNIKYLRERRGLTYRQLEIASSVPFTVIYRIEHSKTLDPCTCTVISLAKALHASLDSLLFEDLSQLQV